MAIKCKISETEKECGILRNIAVIFKKIALARIVILPLYM
jgi:hypothetical protein